MNKEAVSKVGSLFLFSVFERGLYTSGVDKKRGYRKQ
jgi:hypothetical protein